MNYAALKVTELKTELRARGLPVSGPKAELVERLTLYMAQQESLTSTTAPTTSTVVTEEKKVEEAEDDLDDLLLDNDLSTEDNNTEVTATATSNDVKPNIDPVQISSMTETDKKQARADRFKTGTESNNSNSNNISTADDLAAKKSRAERFGNVESAAAKDLEAEKKKSRADRFGTGGNSGTSGTNKTAAKTEENNSVDSEAKKRRAERFGIVESDVSPKKSAKITSYEKDPVDAEKLKSRAERFGVVSLEDKSKQALRAARFGV